MRSGKLSVRRWTRRGWTGRRRRQENGAGPGTRRNISKSEAAHACMHADTHTHTHGHACMHAYTSAHTQRHIHTHTITHTEAHTPSPTTHTNKIEQKHMSLLIQLYFGMSGITLNKHSKLTTKRVHKGL